MLTACKKCSKCFRSYFILVVFLFNLYLWTIKNHVFEYFRLIALLKNSTRFRSSRERWRWCWCGCWISIIFFYFLFLGALPERYCTATVSLLLQIVISFMFIKITIKFVLCICVFVRRLCIRGTPGCYKLSLGKDGRAKSDEFSEKFQTAFKPPLIFGK